MISNMYGIDYFICLPFIRLGGRYLVLILMHAYFNTILLGHRLLLPITNKPLFK